MLKLVNGDFPGIYDMFEKVYNLFDDMFKDFFLAYDKDGYCL